MTYEELKDLEFRNKIFYDTIAALEKIFLKRNEYYKVLHIDKEQRCIYFNHMGNVCYINDNGGEFNFGLCNINPCYNVPYSCNARENPEAMQIALWIYEGLIKGKVSCKWFNKEQLKTIKTIYNVEWKSKINCKKESN